MKKAKVTLFTLAFVVIGLFLCQSCNPYAARRVPLGNYPYMNCKNCNNNGKKPLSKNQEEEDCNFESEEEKKEIKPLPIETRKAEPARARKLANNKRSAAVKKSKVVYSNSSQSATSSGYVKLSDTPQKTYQAEQQQVMKAEKKADIENLLDKSNKIENPTPPSTTLVQEQAPSAPNAEGAAKLNDKLQDLQKMINDNKSSQKPAVDEIPQTQSAQTPLQPVQPATDQAIQPVQPIEPVQPSQPTKPIQPEQPAQAQTQQSDLMTPPAYDITNKPIPLPQ